MKEEKLNLIVFVDREDLGASIDSIHWGEIKPTDLEEDTIEYLLDNIKSLEIENLEELEPEAQKEAAINKFLEIGTIWANDYNSQLAILTFDFAAIKGKRQKGKGE